MRLGMATEKRLQMRRERAIQELGERIEDLAAKIEKMSRKLDAVARTIGKAVGSEER
jgi:prefoldin subunit 5